MESNRYFRRRWTHFAVPDPSFAWYAGCLALGVALAMAVFGGLLWHFHQGLVGRLGLAEGLFDPQVETLVVEYSRQLLMATGFAALGAALFVMVTCLYLLHRIVGPIYRLKREMRGMAGGGPIRELSFRRGDQLQDLAEHFNELMRQLGAIDCAAEGDRTDGAAPTARARH